MVKNIFHLLGLFQGTNSSRILGFVYLRYFVKISTSCRLRKCLTLFLKRTKSHMHINKQCFFLYCIKVDSSVHFQWVYVYFATVFYMWKLTLQAAPSQVVGYLPRELAKGSPFGFVFCYLVFVFFVFLLGSKKNMSLLPSCEAYYQEK